MTTTDTRPLIDVEQVEREFREIIRQNPDRTNGNACSYVIREDDQVVAACIAGVWLIEKHGMDPTWFMDDDLRRNREFFVDLYERYPDVFPFSLTGGALELVRVLQEEADNDGKGNVPWDELVV